ncbi:MAG: AtpZ/AtpI family protein [Candidatus Jorgensenbacteria bacterium]
MTEPEKSLFRPLALAWELGYTIAIPLVALALGGRFLDKSFDTSPIFLLIGIFVSIFISSFLIYRKTKKILSQF